MSDTDHLYLERHEISMVLSDLRRVRWLTTELDAVITRQTAHSEGPKRARINDDGPLIFHEHASDLAHELTGTLQEWTEHTCTERQLPWPGHGRAPHYAAWLDTPVMDLALTEQAPAAATQIAALIRRAITLIDLPAPRTFAGPCQSTRPGTYCHGIYVDEHTTIHQCRPCGAICDINDMRETMRLEIRGRLYTAHELTTALCIATGTEIAYERVRSWIRRGALIRAGITHTGEDTYSLDDALDVHTRKNKPPRRTA